MKFSFKKHQRSFSIGVVLLLGICAILSFKKPFQQPAQKYTVTLSFQEWQAVVGAIVTPDDYSNNVKKQISELVQKNMVIVADTTKPKK